MEGRQDRGYGVCSMYSLLPEIEYITDRLPTILPGPLRRLDTNTNQVPPPLPTHAYRPLPGLSFRKRS